MARLRRKGYIGPVLAIYAVVAILTKVPAPNIGASVLVWALLIWALFGFAVPRSHDIGNSGWYCLIPFYGFWLIFKDSQPFTNKWGPDPKGRGNQV